MLFPRKGIIVALLPLLAPLGGHASVCAFPVVTEAAIDDIHENSMNGPIGFAYIVNPGGEKTGRPPRAIAGETFDTDVYASDFQGPVPTSSRRMQHEWTADGWTQVSFRRYPLVFQHHCRPSVERLRPETVRIKEDDDFLSPDDKMGAFEIDPSRCREILTTAPSGWTKEFLSLGKPYERGGPASVKYVAWKLWCYTCPGETDCGEGIDWRR